MQLMNKSQLNSLLAGRAIFHATALGTEFHLDQVLSEQDLGNEQLIPA